MNLRTVCFAFILGAAFPSFVHAVPQPRIKAAYEHLNSALGHVTQAKREKPKQHVTDALGDLELARTSLENARKNKGSYRSASIRLIDDAKGELENGTGPERFDKAAELIKKAIEKSDDARRAGNH